MKNKKGFTLVELLAVVVILLAISVIAISSISAAIERNNKKKDKAIEKFIITYAEVYFDDYKNTALNSAGLGCVDVFTLQDYYNLDESSLYNSDNVYMSGCVSLTYNNGKPVYKYNAINYVCNTSSKKCDSVSGNE